MTHCNHMMCSMTKRSLTRSNTSLKSSPNGITSARDLKLSWISSQRNVSPNLCESFGFLFAWITLLLKICVRSIVLPVVNTRLCCKPQWPTMYCLTLIITDVSLKIPRVLPFFLQIEKNIKRSLLKIPATLIWATYVQIRMRLSFDWNIFTSR